MVNFPKLVAEYGPAVFIVVISGMVLFGVWDKAQYNAYCEANRQAIDDLKAGLLVRASYSDGRPCFNPTVTCGGNVTFPQTTSFRPVPTPGFASGVCQSGYAKVVNNVTVCVDGAQTG